MVDAALFDEEKQPVDEGALSRLTALAKTQLECEARVAQLEASLKQAKRELAQVQERELPELMAEIGMSTFTLLDGRGVTIKEDISASLAGDKKDAAIAWLKQHGYSDLVSVDVEVGFGAGDEDKARALAQELIDKGIIPKLAQSVNTGTLKSLIRELLEQGEEVPLETLGAYRWRKAVIK